MVKQIIYTYKAVNSVAPTLGAREQQGQKKIEKASEGETADNKRSKEGTLYSSTQGWQSIMGSNGKVDWFAFKYWRHVHSTIQVTTFEKPVQKIIVANSCVGADVVVIAVFVVLVCVIETFVEIVEITFVVSTKMTTIESEMWTSPPRMQVNISYCLWSACWTIV